MHDLGASGFTCIVLQEKKNHRTWREINTKYLAVHKKDMQAWLKANRANTIYQLLESVSSQSKISNENVAKRLNLAMRQRHG